MPNSLVLPTRVSQQIKTLAQQQDQPLCAYLYDLNNLEAHIKQLRHVLPENVELFYAAKANPSGPILTTLAPYVDGFEAASGGELAHLHQQLLDKPLIFGGPGKMPRELQQAIELDVDAIHVESLTELQRIGALTERLNRPASIFLRMNIDIGDITLSKLAMGGKPTPFGLDESELSNALVAARFPASVTERFPFSLDVASTRRRKSLGVDAALLPSCEDVATAVRTQ